MVNVQTQHYRTFRFDDTASVQPVVQQIKRLNKRLLVKVRRAHFLDLNNCGFITNALADISVFIKAEAGFKIWVIVDCLFNGVFQLFDIGVLVKS